MCYMEIYNLADKMFFFEEVVEWLFNEWGVHGEKNNKEFWKSWVNSSLSKIDIPQTYIAIEGDELIATFSLWRCDLQSRQDLFPWFGGLIVKKNYRSKGIGKLMQYKAFGILHNLGYQEVYCFSEFANYYETTGWCFQGMIPDEKGIMVRLYKRTTEL